MDGIKEEEGRHVLALVDGELALQLAWPSAKLAEQWKKAMCEGAARIVDAADGMPTRRKDRQKRSSIFLGLKKAPSPTLKCARHQEATQ